MGNNIIIEFSKAQVSSVVATACDFCTTAVIFNATRHVVLGTASGAIVGGIVNCIINYCWTFYGSNRSRFSVFRRYLIVWLGSILLNTYGTEWGVKLVQHLWLAGNQSLALVMCTKAAVAIMVAIFWNFLLQKYFVYKRK